MAVFYYIFYAQTRLEGKNFILLHPSKHWRLAAFTFYQGKSYWRAGDLDQGINLEWPNQLPCYIIASHGFGQPDNRFILLYRYKPGPPRFARSTILVISPSHLTK